MRSPSRRLSVPVGLLLSASLLGAACSKTTTTDAGGSGGSTPGGSTPSASFDYASLSGTINGSGSSFAAPLYEEVIGQFKDVAPKLTVNYGGGGSGKGKQDLADKVVDFAGTDSLVKDEDKAKYKGGAFLYFPTAVAPITVSYNIGVDKLQLSAPVLANIFQGNIKTWNDPAIAGENAGVSLPSTPIVIAHRTDGSGTTSTFTKYLKAAAPSDWKLDAGDTVNWPTESQGGNGNAGVAKIVKDTTGAIGYVDYSDAKATGLKFAWIKNKAGKYTEATLAGASAAAEAATVKDDLTFSALDTAGDAAYPITASTYILTYAKQDKADTAKNLQGWLTYVLTAGQTQAESVDFAKLPDNIAAKALAQVAKITS